MVGVVLSERARAFCVARIAARPVGVELRAAQPQADQRRPRAPLAERLPDCLRHLPRVHVALEAARCALGDIGWREIAAVRRGQNDWPRRAPAREPNVDEHVDHYTNLLHMEFELRVAL